MGYPPVMTAFPMPCDLARTLPIHCPVKGLGKAANDDPRAWGPATHKEIQMNFWLLALGWLSAGHCEQVENESSGWNIFL